VGVRRPGVSVFGLPGAGPTILKISWNKWHCKNLTRSWVLKFYAKVTKRNGDDNKLESLKIMQSAIEWYLREKNYPLGIVHLREFHNSKEIHCRITQDPTSNSFSKDNKKSQPQPQKKGRSSIIDSGERIERLYINRLFLFWIQYCLFLCYARMSVHHMTSFCILNEM